MFWYWFFLTFLSICSILMFLFLYRIFNGRRSIRGELIFIWLILGIIIFPFNCSLLFSFNYYEVIKSERIEPSNTLMMCDGEEAIIKYNGKRWSITEKEKIDLILDSCYYIEIRKNSNIFKDYLYDEYILRTYKKEEYIKPVKIIY